MSLPTPSAAVIRSAKTYNAKQSAWSIRSPGGVARYPGGRGDAGLAADVWTYQIVVGLNPPDGKLGPATIEHMNLRLAAWASIGAPADGSRTHTIAQFFVLPGMPWLPQHAYQPQDWVDPTWVDYGPTLEQRGDPTEAPEGQALVGPDTAPGSAGAVKSGGTFVMVGLAVLVAYLLLRK